MDFYPTNPHTLRKLLAKRQNPCTQIFKQKPSSMTTQPKDQVNFNNKASNIRKKDKNFSVNLNSLQKRLFNSKKLHSSISSDAPQKIATPTTQETPQHTIETFETLQKKVKISVPESSSRKTSFDSRSDQSTTCDTHSEGAQNLNDYLTSPPLSSQPSTVISVTGLGDEMLSVDQNLKLSLSENPILKDNEPLSTCPLKESFMPEKVRLRCDFRHKLKTPVCDTAMIKCPKCEALLRKCQLYAKENGGSCLNENYENIIHFKCSKDHKWSTRYRNFNLDWCPECAEEKREVFRKKCEEERKKREKKEEEYQKKLFEEARRKAVNSSYSRRPIEESDLAYFKKIDTEAENLAKQKTTKFMAEQDVSNGISFQQALQVNKLLATPEECLEKYMQSLDIETVKSEFRRIAKIIHPDKNKHPDAGIAFQKIHKVYEAVVGRIEGR